MIMWSDRIASAYKKLCSNILTKKPVAETPVNINNFLCFPFILLLVVENNKAVPRIEKIINGVRKRNGPWANSVTTGTKNIHIITKKTPIRA